MDMDLSGVPQWGAGKAYVFLVKMAGVAEMIISPPSCLCYKCKNFDRDSQLLTFGERSGEQPRFDSDFP